MGRGKVRLALGERHRARVGRLILASWQRIFGVKVSSPCKASSSAVGRSTGWGRSAPG
ncbi:MAG: hypothetical protein H5U02_01410 [Clostridia bacterium]|nr:hypothetical protein [Clostridia bacterium]